MTLNGLTKYNEYVTLKNALWLLQSESPTWWNASIDGTTGTRVAQQDSNARNYSQAELPAMEETGQPAMAC